jgi:hypothetical protein
MPNIRIGLLDGLHREFRNFSTGRLERILCAAPPVRFDGGMPRNFPENDAVVFIAAVGNVSPFLPCLRVGWSDADGGHMSLSAA